MHDSPQITRYGHTWPSGWSDLDIELEMFRYRIGPDRGGLGPEQHFKNIVNALWGPHNKTKQFVFHPWADKMLKEACQWNYLGVAGPRSSGKCLAPDTPVLFFDGTIKPAKEVREGDQLMGDDSTPRNVLTTNPGRSNMVRIVPVKGDPWECNDDHILTLKRAHAGRKSKRRVGDVVDISVKDYLASSNTFKEQYKLFCTGVEFPEQPVEIDPYLYGVWLGDGTTGRPIITCPDSETEVIERMKLAAEGGGFDLVKQVYGDKCPGYSFSTRGRRNNPFLDLVAESSGMERGESPVGKEKRILPRYLQNSREVRLQLLAGIIDTDGSVADTSFEISCSLKGLSDDIAYLARSLGFRVTITPRTTQCNGKEFPSYRLRVMGNVQEIPTGRKKCEKKKQRLRSDCTSFQIEQLGEGDWFGFTLDGNGRFLLGDFTVTHNTDFFAVWALVNFLCAPKDTLVMVVSTTLKDSKQRIWGSIEDYFLAVPGFPGKLVSSMGFIRYDLGTGEKQGSDKRGLHLIAGERKKGKEASGNLIGKKADRLILIADEHTELSEAINQAFYGNLSGNPWAQFIGIANPASYYDAFGEFVEPLAGWLSINEHTTEWITRYGKCIRFDGLQSPNVTSGKSIYPFLLTPEKLEEARRNLGENTAIFWRMIRGFWCPAGSGSTVFSQQDILKYGGLEGVIWQTTPIQLAAMDPSFTNGGDDTVVYFGKWGQSTEGHMVLLLEDSVELKEDVRLAEESRDFQIAEQFKALCMERGVVPFNAALDATGAGSPFASIVAKVWSNKVLRVNFGGSATDRAVSDVDNTPAHDRYSNKVSEIWYSGAEFLRARQLRGVSRDLARGLCERGISTVKRGDNTLIQVETKRDMKARLDRSPDHEDAALLLVELIRERFKGRVAVQGSESRSKSWAARARKYDATQGRRLTPTGWN